jgi:hypothetical protein
MKTYIKLILSILIILTSTIMFGQKKGFYKKNWEKIDSLENEGLPKSALEITEKIYAQAKKENNTQQKIKAFIFRLKYKNAIEENAFEKLCHELDSAAAIANFPEKNIMHSMLADMYWWYYQNNRYKFAKRSNTINFEKSDMQTWTLEDLVNEVIVNYKQSLAEEKKLQQLKIKDFKELIVPGTKPENLHPTLYDFLAKKAIKFFVNTQISLNKPADNFELKEEEYFADAQDFVKFDIHTSDTLSLHFHGVKIMQDLLKFRLSDKENTDALIDADIFRLRIAYRFSVNNNKEKLYLEALKNLENKYKNIPFSANVSYLIAEYYYQKSSLYKPLNKQTEKYHNYRRIAFDICQKIINKYPNTYPAKRCESLKISIETHNLSFLVENYVMPNRRFATKVFYRNTPKVYVRIAKISRENYKKINDKNYGEDLYNKLKKKAETFYENTYDLPGDNDFHAHSLELLFDGLKPGLYVLFVANNPNFTYKKAMASYKVFNVTNIAYAAQRQYNGSTRFTVMNRETGMPLQGVSCQTWYEKYDYKKGGYIRKLGTVYTTDKNGNFTIKGTNQSIAWYVDFKLGDNFLSTNNYYYTYNDTHSKRSDLHTSYFTDRAIYRPGQTVYFKGITIETDGENSKIVPNHTEIVTFYDVNRQKIAQQELTTNEYGTFSGTFDIPMGLLNGNFSIQSENGSINISVEEYKRPKFEVKMLPFKGNYLLNDDVAVQGEAISYSGAPLSDAKVKYRITRSPKWRGWWYWNIPVKSVEIANGELITDDAGHFTVNFKALPDLAYAESEFLSFNYSIKIDVTDINGETQSTSANMSIGYRALQVSLPINELINKENDIYDDEEQKYIEIGAYNLNYQPVNAQGEIKIYKLKDFEQAFVERDWEQADKHLYTKEEWYKLYPGHEYENEADIRNLEKENEVFATHFNTAESRKLDFSIVKKFKPGMYVAEITSKDAFGNPVSNKHFFTVYSTKDKRTAYKTPDFFATINNYCEPGETAQYMIGTSDKDIRIIYQIEHQGKIISNDFLKLNNEQKLINIAVEEKYRGNFSVHFVFIKNNRYYYHTDVITVPYTNKILDIEFETFRDKLQPGEKEQWRIKITGHNGEKVAAEMLATLYDASLDLFKANDWYFNVYHSYYTERKWSIGTFGSARSSLLKKHLDDNIYAPALYDPEFNWFNFSYYNSIYDFYDAEISEVVVSGRARPTRIRKKSMKVKSVAKEKVENYAEPVSEIPPPAAKGEPETNTVPEKDFSDVKVRSNFNETAFFYPHLRTNEKGEVIIEFTIPESLTKWKMLGLATTKDLKIGHTINSLVTQKDLMLMPNAPRFFRENDKITFPVKISNISDKDLNGTVRLEMLDALTMKPIKGIFTKGEKQDKTFDVKANGNTLVNWHLQIPEGTGAIMYKVVAKAGEFSDGEQKALPVLTNRMLVTESMPLPIRGKETKTFKFKKLINSGKSNTLRNYKLTLEFSSHPAWYAVQALPYLMEYPYECTEQTFSRFYANSIASHIANSNPKIKRVFDSWKNTPESKALLSNLEKNQELKAVLLEETPWVLEGKNESERKKRVGLLFDLNRMSNELSTALRKIQKAQKVNGAWPWFNGMPESRYITQHIVTGMGHLDKLGVQTVRNDDKTWNMLKKAIGYLDKQIVEDYQDLKKYYNAEEMKKNHLGAYAIQYFYGRTYFLDIPIPESSKKAFEYFKGQMQKYWLSQSKYLQGMIALSLYRLDDKTIPAKIVKSLKEHSLNNEEMGMYWKDNVAGYYWYQAPIENQALMIEVFDEVAKDEKSVEDMKVWLLKQKQTQDWKTTKATTEAVFALLMRGSDLLASDELVEIKMGNQIIDPKKMDNVKIEAGTGYFKTSWSGNDIKPDMGNVTLSKKDAGVAWGAVYWQYFEQLDKITTHETPLKLKKQLFIEKMTEGGKVLDPLREKNQLKIGDKVIVRIELRVDRRMEYVHMKDMRASGFEPLNVISRYKWQDGLGYYESTKDASTNFFIEYLPKGTYVFEYPLRVTHEGDFSNGITTIQCMYAPEFTSHSEGIRVKVE